MRLSTRDYITKRLSESERYAQLAEECNELGKAALKIRRIIPARRKSDAHDD